MKTNCRIGKVKLRNGAEVRVFKSDAQLNSDYCQKEFREALRTISDEHPTMKGFFVVAWDSKSVSDHATIMEGSKRTFFDLPGFVHTVATNRINKSMS